MYDFKYGHNILLHMCAIWNKKKDSEGYHMSDASDFEDPRRPSQHHTYPHVLGEAKADIYLSSSGRHIIKYTHMNTLKLMSPYQLHW